MGVNSLFNIFNPKYYEHLAGGTMEAFGKLFKKNVIVYSYPYLDKESNILFTSENLEVNEKVSDLYKFFKSNHRIIDVRNYKPEHANIYSSKVLEQINNNEEGWDEDRKSTRLNSSHVAISYAVFCLKKKIKN